MWSQFVFLVIFQINCCLSLRLRSRYPDSSKLGTAELDEDGTCVKQGFTCLNCTSPAWCIGGLKIQMQECPEGHTCNALLGNCTRDQHVPVCSEKANKYQHECKQVGTFPDPFDCQKFHFCYLSITDNSFKRIEARCPRNYAYNPGDGQCSIKLELGQCVEHLIPECTMVGQNGTHQWSTNYYYVCLEDSEKHILPRMFVCPNGYHFWDGFCHERRKYELIPGDFQPPAHQTSPRRNIKESFFKNIEDRFKDSKM